LQLFVVAIFGATANADIVFSNDFEANTTGFAPGGSIVALNTTSLPTDGGGLGSANQSKWLGRLGSGVAKSGSIDEIVTLNVTGLSAGQTYLVAFDLLVGTSWDGSAGFYGPDSWRFAVDGVRQVNTTFTNGNQGQEYGAYSPQRYSDSTYNSLIGPDFGKFTGADAFFTTGGTNYAQHYGIYRFGRGAGNPVLSFVATDGDALLEFARFGNTTDSGDEYWALDNVLVTSAVPEPASLGLLALAIVCALAFRMRTRRSCV
jgi:hypothetical protein